jgi:hypothetical protein
MKYALPSMAYAQIPVILIFAFAIAVVISESSPTLFGIVKLNCFDFFAFAILIPPFIKSLKLFYNMHIKN